MLGAAALAGSRDRTLVAVVRVAELLEPGDKRAPWHAHDQYGIRFELVAALPRPITAKGAQGVWRLSGR